jgi:hypothetical protein
MITELNKRVQGPEWAGGAIEKKIENGPSSLK